MRRFAILLAGTSTLTAACATAQDFERGSRNTDLQPAYEWQFRAPLEDSGIAIETSVVADGLVHPWGIEVLPGDAGYLVTERPGRLRVVAEDGTLGEPISNVPEVLAQDQGGLLDVTLAPDFETSRRIYLTYAKPLGGGESATAAAYATLSEDMTALEGVTEIFVQEPGSTVPKHYGSRVELDDAGHVFITTGEHSSQRTRVYAQDLDKTYGKTIRLTRDGAVPSDNPFVGQDGAVDSIWSWGHRNIQGAMVVDGTLWTIEHGPAGGDELNEIEPGANYGWPVISYGEQYSGGPIGSGEAQREGMEQPVYFWDPVIAPGGMTMYDGDAFPDWQGDVFIGSLAPGGIVRLELQDGRVAAEERLQMDLGRVRDITVDDDGGLLAITDFRNGEIVKLLPANSG
ncbi:Soluble aldose sugar dehydrogenase YliI precursor [Roseivivax jejudonensis]|uniref:Soluble aldose sugar dehydrogenase YliI n=1 Tax=Roseivivax jejudonensis TaxID=1529041 RepID=A0A1X6YU13_9RHOB|nr:PQQ-dependent sugar dehydrogenase [Roseivivax jejudonensis]SLN29324.1 Soluble aldose sugar dehydrogenase YliI precursor [Roseivivax jejudonensis]